MGSSGHQNWSRGQEKGLKGQDKGSRGWLKGSRGWLKRSSGQERGQVDKRRDPEAWRRGLGHRRTGQESREWV